MTGRSRPKLKLTRRAVVQAAALLSAPPGPATVTSAAALCLEWLRTDIRLETLTLEWSRAESDLIATTVGPASSNPTNRMQRLEREIALIDRKRSVLLDRIVTTPAGSPEEAVSKLLVAKRLLEGEGGAEHDLVADAVMGLATVHGLVD